MNPYVRDRIHRKLETLNDERLYQILDYVEFLEARYAEKPANPVNVLKRVVDGVEDQLRAGGVAVGTISGTMGFLNKAVGALNGVAQSTMNVAGDVVNAARSAVEQVGAPTPGTPVPPPAPAPPTAPPASSPPSNADQPPRPNGT